MVNALILVDIQNDFVPGGALPVPSGDLVVPVANRLMDCFDLIVATRDWHPADHGSFASQHPGRNVGDVVDLEGLPQILWPDHCVQETVGAEFVPGLSVGRIDQVFVKGVDRYIDSYSGFFDNGHRRATGLEDFLRDKSVKDVFIVGLATDYCVKFTALDAVKLGFGTHVVVDGVRGVELTPGDCDRAMREMTSAGVTMIRESQID